jgi:hypothetical protein
MKRRMICYNATSVEYIPPEIPEDMKLYANGLRLLRDVPFTYLFANSEDFGEESLRFFILDINWTDALTDGAFSIGRQCVRDFSHDRHIVKNVNKGIKLTETPRMKRMHPNHKKYVMQTVSDSGSSGVISGFVMRSCLVRRIKGLKIYGYDNNGEMLNILRMETISDDMLICMFDGKISEIIIEEPETGLIFGSSDVNIENGKISRSIDLRSAADDVNIGKRISSMCIDDFTEENGRLNAAKLATAIGDALNKNNVLDGNKITPSRFAFEMIATAHRAKFTSSEKGEKNGK